MFAWLRHNLGAIVLVFAAWTAGTTITTYKERASLLPQVECAYHEGYSEGYRDHAIEGIDQTLATSETIQEDDPRWDCATMGNRICGASDTPLDTKGDKSRRVKK